MPVRGDAVLLGLHGTAFDLHFPLRPEPRGGRSVWLTAAPVTPGSAASRSAMA